MTTCHTPPTSGSTVLAGRVDVDAAAYYTGWLHAGASRAGLPCAPSPGPPVAARLSLLPFTRTRQLIRSWFGPACSRRPEWRRRPPYDMLPATCREVGMRRRAFLGQAAAWPVLALAQGVPAPLRGDGAVVRRHADRFGETHRLPAGNPMWVKVSTRDTGGAFFLMEQTNTGRRGPARHYHF